ncbi:MAG: FHA domain-containing protein [Planctomycetes bacterium]|nr:FHA domain-containing protein [Planctomycetota bacterium]
MPPQLVAMSDGPNILLDKPVILIGRHQECDIQIPSRQISRRHCCVAQVNDHLVVRDLCSTNGIRINGVRVTEGSLKVGDELTIANFRYQVNTGQENGGLPPPHPPIEGRPPARPVLADDPFVSLDRPVPLHDPSGPHAAPGPVPKLPPAPLALPSKPLILPENMELANSSGDFQVPPANR